MLPLWAPVRHWLRHAPYRANQALVWGGWYAVDKGATWIDRALARLLLTRRG